MSSHIKGCQPSTLKSHHSNATQILDESDHFLFKKMNVATPSHMQIVCKPQSNPGQLSDLGIGCAKIAVIPIQIHGQC